MKQLLFLILALLLQSLLLQGQTDNDPPLKSKTQITLNAGINTGAIRDYNISPLIYRKTGPYFGFDYERKSSNQKNLFFGNISYFGGNGKTVASDSLTTVTLMDP